MMITGNSHCMITAGIEQVVGDACRRPSRSGPASSKAFCTRCCSGASTLSGAGRKRRSSAKTVSATMASTTISPKVSKPRKSTRMTLTTLRPPPSA